MLHWLPQQPDATDHAGGYETGADRLFQPVMQVTVPGYAQARRGT